MGTAITTSMMAPPTLMAAMKRVVHTDEEKAREARGLALRGAGEADFRGRAP